MMHHSLIKKKKKRWQLGINCWGGKKKKNHQDIRTGNSSLFHLEPHHTTLSLIIFLLQHTYFLLVRVYKGTVSRLQIIIRSIRITYEYSFMLLSFLSVYPSYIYFSSPCISSSLLISPLSYCLSLSFILTVFLYFVTALHFLLLSAFPLSFSCIFSSSAFLVFNSSLSLSLFFISLAYFPFTFLSRALSLYISLSVYLCFCFFLFSFPSNAYSLPLSFTPVLPHSFFFFLYSLLPFHFFFFLSVNLAFLHKLFFFRLVLLRV